MSVDRKIQNLLNTIDYKITDIQTRLDALDANSEVDELMPTVLAIVDELGCCPPKYCEPDPCSGTGFNISVSDPKKYTYTDPVQPEDLFTILGSLVVEALYLEGSNDVALLPLNYRNINTGFGHVCDRAKFGVYANDVYLGTINLNNLSDSTSVNPAPLTGGIWTGSSYARYTRIDVSVAQASQILTTTSSTILNFTIRAEVPDPHSDITWLRISKKVGNELVVVQDVLAREGSNYPVDIATRV